MVNTTVLNIWYHQEATANGKDLNDFSKTS